MGKMNLQIVLSKVVSNEYARSTLENICNEQHVSQVYFSRWFKKTYGMNYRVYRIQYRFCKATSLLVDTNKSMFEIALECGYKNEYSFSRSFKLMTGVSPTRFKELMKSRKISFNDLSKNHLLNLDRVSGIKRQQISRFNKC